MEISAKNIDSAGVSPILRKIFWGNTMCWRSRPLAVCLVLGLGAASGAPALASSDGKTAEIVIMNDPGGSVAERARFIRSVKRSNTPVRIEGWRCHSSCTMLAFLPQTCIHPETTFGFHGPFIDSRKMTDQEFEEWSRFMAQYYPPDFRRWFLKKARYVKRYDLLRVKGSELIRFGAKPCKQRAQVMASAETEIGKN